MPQLHPLLPSFTAETAAAKVQAVEDASDLRAPQRAALAYRPDSVWRNRDAFFARAERAVFGPHQQGGQ